jgi:hypothetical protein
MTVDPLRRRTTAGAAYTKLGQNRRKPEIADSARTTAQYRTWVAGWRRDARRRGYFAEALWRF